MTDPFEQARESLEPAEREPDWTSLRRDTLARIASDRARARAPHHSPRWTALVAAAAVAAVVVGVLGVAQLTDRRERADPSPTATPLEPLAAEIIFLTGRDEQTTLRVTVSPDELVLTTSRYTYVQRVPAAGGARQATLIDHRRRGWRASDDGLIQLKLLTMLPTDLADAMTAEPLAPLLDPSQWRVRRVSTPGADADRLTLRLTSAPVPRPTRDPSSTYDEPTPAHVDYVIDTERRLPVHVVVYASGDRVLLDGVVEWSTATDGLRDDEVPQGYRNLGAPGSS